MKCPQCKNEFKSISELISTRRETPWYKYKEETLECPLCNTNLVLKESNKIMIKYLIILITYVILAVASFFYSTMLFIIIVIFIAISSMPIINYLMYKQGELVQKAHNK